MSDGDTDEAPTRTRDDDVGTVSLVGSGRAIRTC